jgi:translation elongation factor EF-1beta
VKKEEPAKETAADDDMDLFGDDDNDEVRTYLKYLISEEINSHFQL